MRNIIKTAAAIAIIAVLACGCASKGPSVNAFFTPANEILTYEKIDPQKTQLVVSTMGDASVRRFSDAFEELNPDVQIICIDITGGNDRARPVVDWVANGCAPDVMFNSVGMFTDEEIKQYFRDLSDSSLASLYLSETMNRMAIDGFIYSLPGPSSLCCMIYNKTLFSQYGWEVPATFDEFVALCLKIREDTAGAIEPWNPNAKYSNELLTVAEGFTYEQLFGGYENRRWLNEYSSGEATFKGHMEPFYDMLETLVNKGILREEHFTYSATARGKEFAAGKIAMINSNISEFDNEQFDFGYMPFPGTVGEIGYVAQTDSRVLHIPLKEHTEKENDAIDRYAAFFSTGDGQRAYIGDSLMVSNLQNVPANQNDDLVALQPALDAGHRFTRINFSAERTAGFSFSADSLSLINGERSKEQCIADADAIPHEPVSAAVSAPMPVIATVAEDFTVLDTSFYLADVYREKADADIGLINHGAAYRGNLMRLFKGPLNADDVTTLKPRSFGNDAKLEKLSMTGAQLLSALNAPLGSNETTNSVYAYSGLKCEIAPRNALGEKYLSVKLANGASIDENKLYAVAAWQGTVPEEFISGVEETFEGSFEEILTAKLQKDQTLKPANDGRCALRWE